GVLAEQPRVRPQRAPEPRLGESVLEVALTFLRREVGLQKLDFPGRKRPPELAPLVLVRRTEERPNRYGFHCAPRTPSRAASPLTTEPGLPSCGRSRTIRTRLIPSPSSIENDSTRAPELSSAWSTLPAERPGSRSTTSRRARSRSRTVRATILSGQSVTSAAPVVIPAAGWYPPPGAMPSAAP